MLLRYSTPSLSGKRMIARSSTLDLAMYRTVLRLINHRHPDRPKTRYRHVLILGCVTKIGTSQRNVYKWHIEPRGTIR